MLSLTFIKVTDLRVTRIDDFCKVFLEEICKLSFWSYFFIGKSGIYGDVFGLA